MDDLLPPCPDRFQCPITQFRMVDPVLAKDGHSYDRKAIQQWFDAGHNTSPKPGMVWSIFPVAGYVNTLLSALSLHSLLLQREGC